MILPQYPPMMSEDAQVLWRRFILEYSKLWSIQVMWITAWFWKPGWDNAYMKKEQIHIHMREESGISCGMLSLLKEQHQLSNDVLELSTFIMYTMEAGTN